MHRLLQMLLMQGVRALSPSAISPLNKTTTLVLSRLNIIRGICGHAPQFLSHDCF